MKVNFSAPICDLDNKAVKENDKDDKGKDITLAAVATTALLANFPDEQNLKGEDKVRRFKLAEKAHAGGEQEISPEDATLLRTLINKAFPPLVVARAWDLIDPTPPAA